MNITLINANLITQRGDVLGSGIPYMPVGLAYLAATLRQAGHNVNVVDAFGAAPRQMWSEGNYLIQGLTPSQTEERIPGGSEAVVVYAWSVMSHHSVRAIGRCIRQRRPGVRLVVAENPNAVTGYSLKECLESFLDGTFAFAVIGEAEAGLPEFFTRLEQGTPVNDMSGVAVGTRSGPTYQGGRMEVEDLDALPFPAWDLFPLERYWRLGYGHGPVAGKYLALLTSRGCPFRCAFCVIPVTTARRWRGRSSKSVADEMEWANREWGITDFHIEDVNPGVSDARMVDLCEELLRRGLKVTWKLVSGTKIDALRLDTLDLMARAGCQYLSFSPESGSPAVLKAMNKPFRYDLALEMTRRMRHLGIRSQACFVLGFPGETDGDRRMTTAYVRELIRAGVDEIALFIMAPMPGTPVFRDFTGYQDLSDLSFSPSWRQDYPALSAFRRALYARFFLWKLQCNPLGLLRAVLGLMRRRFDTKMAMTFYRAWRTWQMARTMPKVSLQ